MAINLSKNKDSLLSAWKDVLDDKTATNCPLDSMGDFKAEGEYDPSNIFLYSQKLRWWTWLGRRALFGYEGQTNDLKVVGKGDGGIEEMIEDMNSGKIMYAFCRVHDPKTNLPKSVLINWQGEGAPHARKGTCANHVRDVASFFKGAHVTLNARNEEEVDPQLIVEKVAKSTGSAYSFKERADHTNDMGPVGTAYRRVIPQQEIDSQERDQFWEREQKEEKERQEQERKRRDAERKRLENELHQRELTEAAEREARIEARNRNISKLREAERNAEEHSRDIATEIQGDQGPAEERIDQSEILRQERNKEAQALISQRKFDARAVFEKNTCAGQLHNRRSSAAPTSGESVTLNRKASLPSWPPKSENGMQNLIESVPSPVLSPVKKNEENNLPSFQDEVLAPPEQFEESPQHIIQNWQTTQVDIDQEGDELLDNDVGLRARALYDYQAADPTEITFDPGDIITNIDQIDEGWWQGLGPDGTFGLFPANYVELIN